jgi:hypothetical protein
LGRTFTGWIAPACGWRTHSITSSARVSSVGGETESLRRDQVDDEIKLRRLFDRNVGWLCAM